MTPLGELLARRIALTGPIPLAAFMAEALGHPEHGYYHRRHPFGAEGDFVTAPEVSQMFGELIGLVCAELWQRLDSPDPFRLVELGPGRGTLMADALRAVRLMPGFREAADIRLVETSPALRERQRETLANFQVAWHETFETVPDGPILLIANELFDALPVHQLVFRSGTWRERLVAVEAGEFRLVDAASPSPLGVLVPAAISAGAAEGTVFGIAPTALALARAIAERTVAAGGAALLIDYGPASHRAGATLRAIREHAFRDPLTDPGECDLTADVDFAHLAGAAADTGCAVFGPVPQGAWLARLGIEIRAARLKKDADAARQAEIDAACNRLIAPDQMGTLFQVLAIAAPALGVPPGFTAEDRFTARTR